jgi:hypothetical protein
VKILVELTGFDLADAESFARTAKRLIEGLVQRNRELLRRGDLPPIYRSGVLYARDVAGDITLRDALTCLARKWGHCAHLSAWLCAELNEGRYPEPFGRTIDATIRFKWSPRSDGLGQMYHVQVRLPKSEGRGPPGLGQIEDPTNNEGQILDPSRMLGMGRFPAPLVGVARF